MLYASGAAAIINFILNIILIPRIGYLAAAINTTVGYVFLVIITWFFARLTIDYSFEYKKWLKLLLVGIVFYVFVDAIHPSSHMVMFGIKLVIMILFPITLIAIQFWESSEIIHLIKWVFGKK